MRVGHIRPYFRRPCYCYIVGTSAKWTMGKTENLIHSQIYHTIFTRSSNGESNVFFMIAAAIYRIVHIIIGVGRLNFVGVCVCLGLCVRIGHLIEVLNFSVIVHKSRKVDHTRALFGLTSIFNRVFGAYLMQTYA